VNICTLRDGRRVEVRAIRPDDKSTILESWPEMSRRTRYFRFLRPIRELHDRELRYFTEIDHRDHVALIALDPEGSKPRSLGVARWIRDKDEPKVAEFALTVLDSYQGVGLGTHLLGDLVKTARERDVETLRGWVHSENHTMLYLFRKAGAEVVKRESYLYCLDMSL